MPNNSGLINEFKEPKLAQLNFNARNVAPEAPRAPIPAGVYLMVITESDVVATKAGGEMVKLTHQVVDGPCKGRLVWGNINIKNPSAEAERIGQAQLSALCHAVGVLDLNESAMLHGIPVRVRVSIRPAGPDRSGVHREEQNEVKGYEAATSGATMQAQPQPSQAAATPAWGAPAAPAATPVQPAAAPMAPAGNTRPWARRA